MQEENVLENESKVESTNPVETTESVEIEKPVQEVETDKPEKLSVREALEKGLSESRKDEPKGKRIVEKDQLDLGPKKPNKFDKSNEPIKAYEPPAQWTKEEKEDFKVLSPKQQEATLRLINSRKSEIETIRLGREEVAREREELKWAKDLAAEVTPFLKANGRAEDGNVAQTIIKAVKAVRELDTGDPLVNAVSYLRAKGKDVPEELLEAIAARAEGGEKYIAPQIQSLQNDLKDVKSKLEHRERLESVAPLVQAFDAFSAEKNALGGRRFPDLDESEKGSKISTEMGSLLNGQTELSKQFLANAQNRIPNLTYSKLLEEAYKWCGGTVDDNAKQSSKPEDLKKHIKQSNRAASSVPGRGNRASTLSGPVKKVPLREALRLSMEEHADDF